MSDMPDFYVDPKQRGFVRGGFYDEMGGMLVGMRAQWVCDALNAHIRSDIDAARRAECAEAFERISNCMYADQWNKTMKADLVKVSAYLRGEP